MSAKKDVTGKVRVRPFVLIIRDGWGSNDDPKLREFNAVIQADTPVDDRLQSEYPSCLVGCSGEDVGLPVGTMGNSEVGHQNIGAGRIVFQESMRLTNEIRQGTFFENETLLAAIENCNRNHSKLHLLGLMSNAGVHSLLEHLYGLLEMAKANRLDRVFLHAFMDGRDTPPESGKGYVEEVEAKMAEIGVGRIGSVMGRFWGMDRDQRWERVEKAYGCMRYGKGNKETSAGETMQKSYDSGVTDEFVEPTAMVDEETQPLALIEDGDSVVFLNFRGDRPREITRAFVDEDFRGFDRGPLPELHYVCMTEYDATIATPVAFPKPPKMKNIVGAYWSQLGLTQFRCAETEKYAHVTFFYNDYTEPPFDGEDRQIVPSPKVRTYDMKPEMSAAEVTDIVVERLATNKYDVVVVNFANPDMVGHTGVMAAAVKAAETVDQCVGRIIEQVQQMEGSAIITADHGNVELMYDVEQDTPFTAHTTFDVPLILVDQGYKDCKLRDDGILADVIPTALQVMGLDQPQEMTGKSLIVE